MVGTEGLHVEGNRPDTDKQILYVLPYMWELNLKKIKNREMPVCISLAAVFGQILL